MFTADQIKEQLSKVNTGADFPLLAMNLRNIGVTYYETRMEDGRSTYHGTKGYELSTGPNYESIFVADKVDSVQLKADIASHQQGKSDYFQISRECARNGIDRWAVCLLSMTCTYFDKKGNKVWVEHISAPENPKPLFTAEQLKAAHAKVKSGADFPAYIQEIKIMGVTHYETYVTDGHIDYHGTDGHTVKIPGKYEPIVISNDVEKERFRTELKAHQNGRTDFLTFIFMCASTGINKWEISMEEMTCTYYDKSGNLVWVEEIR